jgi:hypothetical protein
MPRTIDKTVGEIPLSFVAGISDVEILRNNFMASACVAGPDSCHQVILVPHGPNVAAIVTPRQCFVVQPVERCDGCEDPFRVEPGELSCLCDRRIGLSEQVARSPPTPPRPDRIARQKALHAGTEVRARGLDQKMKVISHDDVTQQIPPMANDGLLETETGRRRVNN